jgi:hypothetical protein
VPTRSVTEAPAREYLDDCVNCQKRLFSGDMGLRYDEAIYACDECAPSYAGAKDGWEAEKDDDPPGYRQFIRVYEAHLAAGGSRDDKFVTEL